MANESHTEVMDLTSCESEPLAHSGMIQPQGVFLAFGPQGRLAFCSDNAGSFFDMPDTPDEMSLQDFFQDDIGYFRHREKRLPLTESVLIHNVLSNRGQTGDLWLSRQGAGSIAEYEQHAADAAPAVGNMRIQSRADEWPEGFDIEHCLAEIATLSGFAKVMLYKFLGDNSGEVVAEASDGRFEAYFGLRFPASDIPGIARSLYASNPFRVIFDTKSVPVPIIRIDGKSGEPPSLEHSMLRSVSPVHIEYLHNMNVRASASFPIMVLGKLWGLVALHSPVPTMIAPLARRAIAQICANKLSSALTDMHVKAGHRHFSARGHIVEAFTSALALAMENDSFQPPADINQMIQHDGLLVFHNGRWVYNTGGLSDDEASTFLKHFRRRAEAGVFATNNVNSLIELSPAQREKASGALYFRVGMDPAAMVEVIFLRAEKLVSVDWAGNPEKPVERVENALRLSPRLSFEKYTVINEGRSEEWSVVDQMMVSKVQSGILSSNNRSLGSR